MAAIRFRIRTIMIAIAAVAVLMGIIRNSYVPQVAAPISPHLLGGRSSNYAIP